MVCVGADAVQTWVEAEGRASSRGDEEDSLGLADLGDMGHDLCDPQLPWVVIFLRIYCSQDADGWGWQVVWFFQGWDLASQCRME